MKLPRPPILTTPRLTLCALCEQDEADGVRLLTNQEVARTYMLPDFASFEEAAGMFRRLAERSADPEQFFYGIHREGRLIGIIHWVGTPGETVEIGYALHPDWKGCGYMTEALRACIDALFAMGAIAVECYAFEENPASLRVMQKCGMSVTDKAPVFEYRGAPHRCRHCRIDNPHL